MKTTLTMIERLRRIREERDRELRDLPWDERLDRMERRVRASPILAPLWARSAAPRPGG